ncbi:hypothetical protein JW926_09085 [Candidatus Sumerlaeota bacterium]|nr:hypothetical protein [Candidatus Sumerlaeota bacterium]
MRGKFPIAFSIVTKLLVASALAAIFSGCAFLNRDNARALNFVEKKLWPRKTGWKIAASPVVVPLGLVAALSDVFIIHPASVIDDAAGDTGDALWDNFKWDEKYVTACASIPWRGIATPPFYIGNFLGRSVFDIPSRASVVREERQSVENLESARRLFHEEKFVEALDVLMKTDHSRLKQADQIEYSLLLMKSSHKCQRYDNLNWAIVSQLIKSGYAPQVLEIMNEMKASPNPMARWHYFNLSIRMYRDWKTLKTTLAGTLHDPNPIIRYYGLSWFEKREPVPQIMDMIPELERVAKEDPDAMNREYAEQILRRLKEGK